MSAQLERSDAARRADDRAARLAAQTVFAAPMVLTAGAGTGKTTVLIARVLAWCLGPGWERAERALAAGEARPSPRQVAERTLDRVVAITFTEAAAAEMERRAMTALAKVVAGEAVLGYDVPRERSVAQAERLRARALLAAFDHLHVQTIHAFCRRLLADHPLEAGLHPRFEVDARGAARSRVAREVIEERLRASDGADPDLEELLLRGVGAPELEAMLEALLAAAVPARAFGDDPLAPERVQDLVARFRDATRASRTAIGDRFDGLAAKSVGRAVARAVRATHACAERVVATREDFAALLDGLHSEWSEASLKRLAEWSRGSWDADREHGAAGDAVALIEAAARALLPLLRHVLSIDVALLALLHRVVAPLLASAEEQLHALGAESFDGLLRRTRDLLRARSDVTERVRAEIDQLLVDEFQDTDAMQCEIVAALALDADSAARPGLFLVGDPKQSVYGWRNADIGAYMAFVARVRAEPGAVLHALCVNHRSVPAVLDEVERVVDPSMRFEPGVQPAFERLVPCEARADIVGSGVPDLAAVEYWVSSNWDRSEQRVAPKTSVQQAARIEARRLVSDLLRLRREHDVAWKDVGLLFRTSTDLEEYLGPLRDAEIPYTVDRDRSYYRRREVIEAAALVRTVLDPSDQIAQVATLRSAWAGIPDVAWRALWKRSFPDALRDALDGRAGARDRMRAIVEDAARESALQDIPGLAEMAGWEASALHALDVLVALRRSWREDPVDRFVENLRVLPLLEATEAARYPGVFRLANLARFFRELLASLADGGAASVLRGLRRDASEDVEFYEGRPQDATLDAVQVMTIHGAKGLDFEHVYVLQSHKESGVRASAPLLHGEIDGRLEWRLGAGRSVVASLCYDQVRSHRESVEAAELARTLYVALTRAKSRLVLVGCFEPRPRRSDTHAGLVAAARGDVLARGVARISDGIRALAGSAETTEIEGVRLVLIDAASPAPSAHQENDMSGIVDAGRAREDAERLRAARGAAALREQRPFAARASQRVPDEDREDHASASEADGEWTRRRPSAPGGAEVAASVGTAIHALLEHFDWSAVPSSEWERQRARVRAALTRRLAPSRIEVALDRAEKLLADLKAGPLWGRLREVGPHVVARELAVLVPADANGVGAVAYSVGAIDLVYQDPASGEIAVVDFKTDRIETQAEIAERARHHRPQATVYRRAVQETLRLPRAPRFELWFLDASHVEVLEFERAPGEAGLERAGSRKARS